MGMVGQVDLMSCELVWWWSGRLPFTAGGACGCWFGLVVQVGFVLGVVPAESKILEPCTPTPKDAGGAPQLLMTGAGMVGQIMRIEWNCRVRLSFLGGGEWRWRVRLPLPAGGARRHRRGV